MKKFGAAGVAVAVALVSGCMTTESEKSTAAGGLLGAGAGAVLGHNLGDGSGKDRALGAAAGAVAGGLIGNQMGKTKEMQGQINAVQDAQNTLSVWITNANGSKTQVLLRKSAGGQYVGPRGEFYDSMPTEEQLRKVYGM